MNETLLVVLVNYRLADHIQRLLSSKVLEGHRVVLVDNASQPERMRDLAEAHGTDLLLLDCNYGFAGGVNRAIAQAGEHGPVLLLNPDVHLDRSTLSSLQRALADGQLTAVSPLLLNVDGTIQVGIAGGPTTFIGFVLYFLFVSHLVPRARGVFHTRRQLARGLAPEWVSMACLLLEAAAFDRYGPIPEDEIVYAEDVAWGRAATRSGARLTLLPELCVIHEQGAAGGSRAWSGALVRLAKREHGTLQGNIAWAAMSIGLTIRRMLGRKV